MKRKLLAVAVLFFTTLTGFVVVRDYDVLIDIYRSLTIFARVFEYVVIEYVDPVDPEEFLRVGMEEMLEYLDPYSVYVPDDEQERLNLLTTGSYGGLGMIIGRLDSMAVIEEVFEGYGAQRAGLRRGDILYKIDSAVVLHLPLKQIRRYTLGKPGTIVEVTVLRGDRPDTLTVIVHRESVNIPDVVYTGWIDSTIGYIRLERFSRKAPRELKRAIERLRAQRPLRGLVLDLRGNPGGMLSSAVAVVELFVPMGRLIVSTVSRDPEDRTEYYSEIPPLDTTLPLAVLIDSESASASEIVAGALQDLDRAVLVGRPSFGKGLVQKIYALPYYGSLKLTTSRYYTPAGRSIQKIDYSLKRRRILKEVDTTRWVFFTLNGRPVQEGNGIVPDTVVPLPSVSPFVQALKKHRMFFRFANWYYAHGSQWKADTNSQRILQRFVHFLLQQRFMDRQSVPAILQRVRQLAQKEQYSDSLLQLLDAAQQQARRELRSLVWKHRSEVWKLVQREFDYYRYARSERIGRALPEDADVQVARAILNDSVRYARILGRFW